MPLSCGDTAKLDFNEMLRDEAAELFVRLSTYHMPMSSVLGQVHGRVVRDFVMCSPRQRPQDGWWVTLNITLI